MQKAIRTWTKTVALMLAVMLIGAFPATAQVEVDVEGVAGRPGETAMIAVSLSGVESGAAIQSYQFTVTEGAGIDFTGISDGSNTLAGAAGFTSSFSTTSGNVGGFSTGTDITTSGTLVYLMFNLTSEGSGSIELSGFQLNNGDPAVTGDLTSSFAVSNRIMEVRDVTIGTGGVFSIIIDVKDAITAADDVVSFSMDLDFDPTLMSINTAFGNNGVFTNGTMTSGWTVSGGTIDADTYRIAGFSNTALDGDGILVLVSGEAGTSAGIGEIVITNLVLNNGSPVYAGGPGTLTVAEGVDTEDPSEVPSDFVLKGNYPNPFNPSTNIQFDLPETANVSIQVMDMLGREVMSVPSQTVDAGQNRSIQISASSLSSGIYLYRVIAQSAKSTSVQVGTMTLMK